MQTKVGSFLESLTNTVIGIIIAFAAQTFLFKLTNIQASFEQSALVTLGMATISFIRSYVIRRIFTKITFFQ